MEDLLKFFKSDLLNIFNDFQFKLFLDFENDIDRLDFLFKICDITVDNQKNSLNEIIRYIALNDFKIYPHTYIKQPTT